MELEAGIEHHQDLEEEFSTIAPIQSVTPAPICKEVTGGEEVPEEVLEEVPREVPEEVTVESNPPAWLNLHLALIMIWHLPTIRS